ncbi:MAG: DUF3604 domain-containing protein [Gemmatimonadota bacterium]
MPLSTHLPERMGRASIEPAGAFEAGSFQSFTLTYTAGFFGIDDTGSIRIVHRFATDMGRPQFTDPGAAGYVTAAASNGAVLELRHDDKLNIRPWDRTLQIRVVRGFLREGDRIVVRYGDVREGSPGIRLQTFCEDTFEFRVLVDAIATCDYVPLPESPTIAIVSGPPVRWKAVLPTLRPVDSLFRLCLKAEDRWGNPSDRCDLDVQLRASLPVEGLPDRLRIEPGTFSTMVDGLRVREPGDLRIDLIGPDGLALTRSNPLRVATDAPLLPYWGDLHGQSEETIGTNSAREYFEFARDRAFLDICCHQGNDFQITDSFWRHLNELTRELNRDGSFIVFPGYEWSGNTALGGDRNVLYVQEGRPIYRSSRALVAAARDPDGDAHPDAHRIDALFERLQHEDCIVFAHVGGRYADIGLAHDPRLERAVEVHSAWGTFEWIVRDALERGYRVGITANSDGHKGRPGASYPGATTFGALGGLTCVMATELTRPAIADALRRRHHYGTTGSRMLLDTRARFDVRAERFDEDPGIGATGSQQVDTAMMGDIVRCAADAVAFRIEVLAPAAVERIEIRNGLETLETYRPFAEAELGRRIRVIWEGSEYRGRGRQTVWDGSARIADNRFLRVEPLNFYNIDKRFDRVGGDGLRWEALTTGGFGGFDAWLADPVSGSLHVDTALVQASVAVREIGMSERVWDAGGIDRRIRIFRLPDENPHEHVVITRRVPLRKDADNALYVCVTTEDGHRAWSSPIYLFA